MTGRAVAGNFESAVTVAFSNFDTRRRRSRKHQSLRLLCHDRIDHQTRSDRLVPAVWENVGILPYQAFPPVHTSR